MSSDLIATVAFLDVGQGDCTVAVDPESGGSILIDCRAGRGDQAAKYLTQLGADGVSLAVVTHSDWDHIGGVFEAIDRFPVEEVLVNLDTKMDPTNEGQVKLRAAQRALAGLQDRGVAVQPAYAATTGAVGQIQWEVLAPTHAYLLKSQAARDRNTASVVIRLLCGGSSFLVAGDAEGDSWAELLGRTPELKTDFFRLPHHGAEMSGGTSLVEVLDAVSADYHVISVGSVNQYRHPSRETLQVLGSRAPAARVMCTQVNGICSGGGQINADVGIRRLPESSVAHRREDERACPCAGTILVRITTHGAEVVPSREQHQAVMDELPSPMCL